MSDGLARFRLGEIASIKSGKRMPAGGEGLGSVPVIGANGPVGFVAESLFEDNAVVVGRVGANCGASQLVRAPFWATDNTLVVTPGPSVDAVYLASVMRHAGLESLRKGSAQPLIVQSDLKEVTVPLPPLATQRAVGGVLSAIDKRIATCREQSSTLEALAAAIFKSRFVDFDDAIAFDESAQGSIPAGWCVGTLSDLATVTMGQSPKSDTYSDDPSSGPVLVQGMGGMGGRFPCSSVYTTAAKVKIADADDLLMTVRAPVGALNIARCRIALGRGVCGIRSESPAFVEFTLRRALPYWETVEAGTIYPAVNRDQVAALPVVIPPAQELSDWEQFAKPILGQLESLHLAGENLRAIRDALLPKLVTGELEVPESLIEAYGAGEPATAV